MQSNAPPFNLSTLAYILGLIALFVSNTLTALFTNLLARRKQSADILQANALTAKTQAETKAIDSEVALKAFERLVEMEEIIHKQNIDKVSYAATLGKLEWQLGMADQREKLLNQQIQLAHAELESLRKPRVE